MACNDTIKEQIRENCYVLNAMPVVGTASVRRVDVTERDWKKHFEDELFSFYRKLGNSVNRQGFGNIEISVSHLSNALRYAKTEGEAVAFFVAHYVLKHGAIISFVENHKNRGLDTITIAAPVELNGIRGNMAIVVKTAEKNRYKAHRILTPDGNIYTLDEKKHKARKGTGIADQSLSNPTSCVLDDDTISQVNENVKPYSQNSKTTFVCVTGIPIMPKE